MVCMCFSCDTFTHTHTAVELPLVRTTSWLNRKGLSLAESEINIDKMEVSLLVLIHASGNPIGRKRRDVIRHTWVSDVVLDNIALNFGTRVMYK